MELETIRVTLRSLGFKLTPQRDLIINSLLQAGRPLTAREVLESVQNAHPRMSFDTVYRNLSLLSEIGVVNRINLKVRFNSRFEIADDHRHHLVCLGCGNTRPVELCPFGEAAAGLEKKEGFRIVNHAFEIYGYCPGCNAGLSPDRQRPIRE